MTINGSHQSKKSPSLILALHISLLRYKNILKSFHSTVSKPYVYTAYTIPEAQPSNFKKWQDQRFLNSDEFRKFKCCYHIPLVLSIGLPYLLQDLPCGSFTPAGNVHHIFCINHYAVRYYFLRKWHNRNGNFSGLKCRLRFGVVTAKVLHPAQM